LDTIPLELCDSNVSSLSIAAISLGVTEVDSSSGMDGINLESGIIGITGEAGSSSASVSRSLYSERTIFLFVKVDL
jgi:hypothetical protein